MQPAPSYYTCFASIRNVMSRNLHGIEPKDGDFERPTDDKAASRQSLGTSKPASVTSDICKYLWVEQRDPELF